MILMLSTKCWNLATVGSVIHASTVHVVQVIGVIVQVAPLQMPLGHLILVQDVPLDNLP